MNDNIEVLRGLVAKVAERLETTAFNLERIRVVDDNARRFAAEDIRSAIATLNNGLNAALAAMGGQGEADPEPPSNEVWPPDGAVWLAPVATDAPANPKLMQYAWGRSNLSTGQMAEAYQCIVSAAQECGQVYRLPVTAPHQPEARVGGEVAWQFRRVDRTGQAGQWVNCDRLTFDEISAGHWGERYTARALYPTPPPSAVPEGPRLNYMGKGKLIADQMLAAAKGRVSVPRDALLEVLRISDRKHWAWDALKAAAAPEPGEG